MEHRVRACADSLPPERDAPRRADLQEARLEGFEPPPTQIRSLRLCPLSYRRLMPEAAVLRRLPLKLHPSIPKVSWQRNSPPYTMATSRATPCD